MKGYSTQDVAELLNLPRETIREIARSGIIDPERTTQNHYRFSFQDIVILRTAGELLSAGVRKATINKSLIRMKRRLPPERSLSSFRIAGDGGAVVILEDDRVLNAESGQIHFNFAVAELAGTVAPLAKQAAEEAESRDHLSSDDWFDLGVDLEAVSPEDAPAAYLRALELDPYHSDAHVNIGRLLQEAGDYLAAQDHYEQALDTDPDNLLATFNLGTLLEDMGRIDEAISVYKQASSFPDAHYNLSRLYELVGQHADALRHLKAYRSLIDPA